MPPFVLDTYWGCPSSEQHGSSRNMLPRNPRFADGPWPSTTEIHISVTHMTGIICDSKYRILYITILTTYSVNVMTNCYKAMASDNDTSVINQ